MTIRSYWTLPQGRGELRDEQVEEPGSGQALVRALCSGVSRGTETLVHTGRVPAEVRELMRAPFQRGDLPGEVCYGYLSVGVVEALGPDTGDHAPLLGQRVFCLYPHVDAYVVPVEALTPVPDAVPSDRALLAGTVETCLNALWDAGPRYGDRVAVVGGGLIGSTLLTLLRRFPLDRLELLDPDPGRLAYAEQIGVTGRSPEDGGDGCDIVFHCSATQAGLATGLELLGDEGELVELSWYGTDAPELPLGQSFHARRLRITASQVGAVSAARRARRSFADRTALSLEALTEPAFDALLTGPIDLDDLPDTMDAIARGEVRALCHVVRHAPE